LETFQGHVHRAESDGPPGLPLNFPRYGHAIRIVAKPKYGEHDQQFKFAEMLPPRHFFDYIEEIVAQPAAARPTSEFCRDHLDEDARTVEVRPRSLRAYRRLKWPILVPARR
jgi:hypothetical protein